MELYFTKRIWNQTQPDKNQRNQFNDFHWEDINLHNMISIVEIIFYQKYIKPRQTKQDKNQTNLQWLPWEDINLHDMMIDTYI